LSHISRAEREKERGKLFIFPFPSGAVIMNFIFISYSSFKALETAREINSSDGGGTMYWEQFPRWLLLVKALRLIAAGM